MQEFVGTWMTYPMNKPNSPGIYLVTVQGISEALFLSYSELSWDNAGVLAWAYKPSIYKRGS